MDEAGALLELQDLDLRILRLTKRLDEMPEKRDILVARAKLVDLRTLLARTRAAARAVDARLKRLEDDAGVITAKMEAEQGKLLSGQIKNPKELQAISMELDSLKRRRDALENEELAEMGKAETAGQQEAKIAGVIEAGERKEAELVAVFKDRGSAIVAEVEEIGATRERVASHISAATLSRYESLRGSKHGIAVGRLDGGTCGACRVSLPAGHVERLMAGGPIGECPKCQRMLVVGGGE
ncbi:MAG TPA: hypothetical protein VF902_03575 [Coriobacteriia bacterium]